MSRKSKQIDRVRQLRQSGVSLARASIYANGTRQRSKARLAGFAIVIFGGFIAAGYGLVAVIQAAALGQSAGQAQIPNSAAIARIATAAPPDASADRPTAGQSQTVDLLAGVTRATNAPALDPVPVLAPNIAPILASVSPAAVADDCVTPLAATATALTIGFGSGSAVLPAAQMDGLRRLVAAVTACPAAEVMIAGHSDASGADYDNMLLSWQRAEVVAAAVATLTDDTSQFETVGYGSREPLLDADGTALDAASRRVELRVLRAPFLANSQTGE